jgi:hypothetical protein
MKFKLISENDTFEVEKGDKNKSVVTIPSFYKGKKVSRIGSYAFHKAKVLEKVIIPEGVTSIEAGTFSQCKNLSHVELPESLKTIEDNAFFDCEKLKSITLPKELKKIGENCFYQTSITNIKLPISLQKIGSSAFSNCEQLNAITIPEKVTVLEEELFYGCINLKTVTLHQGIKTIKKGCFELCESLEVKSNFLPKSIHTISENTFYGCKKIKELYLENSIESIGERAFSFCEGLKRINIPSSVRIIPKYCFNVCESLEFVNLHNGISEIQSNAFAFCKFKEISIPTLIKVIEEGVFEFCDNLEKVVLSPNLKKISKKAFHMCTNLKTIHLPTSLELIEGDAFTLVSSDFFIPYLPNDFVEIKKDAFNSYFDFPDEIDPSFVSNHQASKIPARKTNKVNKIIYEEIEEETNSEEVFCMWCEQEVPHIAWHDDADPDEPICDRCYQNFLAEKDFDKKTEEFKHLTNDGKTEDIVEITQIIPYEMSTKDAGIYFINFLEAYSGWVYACRVNEDDSFVRDYALPKRFCEEVSNEIKINNISQIVLPKQIYDFPNTKQFVEVHFSKKNSIKPIDQIKNEQKSQKILMPIQDYKNLLKNHNDFCVNGKDDNLLYYPKQFFFINSFYVDDLPSSRDTEISELYFEDNGISINIKSIAGLFSFQGLADYRKTNNLMDKYSSYIDKDDDKFLPNFISNAMEHKELAKNIKQLGLIQIQSEEIDDLQFFIVSLEDCKNLQSILRKVNKKVIISL